MDFLGIAWADALHVTKEQAWSGIALHSVEHVSFLCGSARQSVAAFPRVLTRAVLQVIVITGDNKLTAEAICRKVGVFAVDEDLAGKSITGVEFMKLPLDKRRSMLAGNEGACFSRAEPKHKQVLLPPLSSRIIRACHSCAAHCIMKGHVFYVSHTSGRAWWDCSK